jgi:hypothetical protein
MQYVATDWTPADWNYPPVPGKNKHFGTPYFFDGWKMGWKPLPETYVPRMPSAATMDLSNNFTHGGLIPNGEYRILARALRTFGDYKKAEDWQFKLSPTFVIRRNETKTP